MLLDANDNGQNGTESEVYSNIYHSQFLRTYNYIRDGH